MEGPVLGLSYSATFQKHQAARSGFPLGKRVSRPVAADTEAGGAAGGEDGDQVGEARAVDVRGDTEGVGRVSLDVSLVGPPPVDSAGGLVVVTKAPDEIVAQLRNRGEVRHGPAGDEEIRFLSYWADPVWEPLEGGSFQLSLELAAESRREGLGEEGRARGVNGLQSVLEVEVHQERSLVSHQG
jgi:hypothetical protein